MSDKQQRQAEVLARLGRLLDDIDEQTRRPGEKPLRQAVAEQAQERLAEMRKCTCSTNSPRSAPWRRIAGDHHDTACALYAASRRKNDTEGT